MMVASVAAGGGGVKAIVDSVLMRLLMMAVITIHVFMTGMTAAVE